MIARRPLLLAPIVFLALSASGPPAQAGGYHGHGGHGAYGDCDDDWRYCDRYLRDDAPYYCRSGYYGRRHGRHHRRHGYDRYAREFGYEGHGGGYGGGYGGVVCDSGGDRCYRSSEPYWNYREYYRRNGYHWID